MDLYFHKYHGTGNDFILLDNRGKELEKELSQPQVAWLCHRRFGIGADGLILLSDSERSQFRMIYYNSDGQESTMCGNGGRCIAAFARQMGVIQDLGVFEAIDGIHEVQFHDDLVALVMQPPQNLTELDEQAYWIDTGSPHYVQFAQEPIEEMDIQTFGAKIRYNEPYASQGGTNVNLVHPTTERLQVRTYERGVEDETYSCGTGVVASAYTYWHQIGMAKHHDTKLAIDTPGGRLWVQVEDFKGSREQVTLIGPATFVFSGQVQIPVVSHLPNLS